MTIAPFTSDRKLISFARSFFHDRVRSFRKDVAICLTRRGRRRDYAEFPALITCIGFLDLLSGLYAGKIEGHGLGDLKRYAARFMDVANYDPLRLEILYLAFRHKIAHLSFPYVVFDTATKRKEYTGQKQRRVTWTVYPSKRTIPIELDDLTTPKYLTKSVTPWDMSYDCRALISVRKIQIDIIRSIYGPKGYLGYIQSDLIGRESFAKCMKVLFPA
jgi:hypothetical protein